MSPIGRSAHAATKVERKTRSASLPSRSCANLSAMKGLGDGGERVLAAPGYLKGCLLAVRLLDGGGIDALGDQRTPLACGAPRLLQRHRAIGADDAPCRCRSPLEAGVHDEGDATGLAAPRRVAVPVVVDASAEGRDDAVQMSLRVPRFAGATDFRNRLVSCRFSVIDKSPNSGFRHTRTYKVAPTA